ncbi:hypothetical protein Aduo_006902 [Ancylostoma duodenale]
MLYETFGNPLYQGGERVHEIFVDIPDYQLMFAHHLDGPLVSGGYYVEEFHASAGDRHQAGWMRRVDQTLKFWLKLSGDNHLILKGFKQHIKSGLPGCSSLPSTSRQSAEPLKNGTWKYVQYVERFMLIAMRCRRRLGETVTMDDAVFSPENLIRCFARLKTEGVTVGVRQYLAKALQCFYSYIETNIDAQVSMAGQQRLMELWKGRRTLEKIIGELKIEQKRDESRTHVLPSTKKSVTAEFRRVNDIAQSEYNCVMSAGFTYLVNFNTARNKCVYKMGYGSMHTTEQAADREGPSAAAESDANNGLRLFTVPHGNGSVEELWMGSYPIPKNVNAVCSNSTFRSQCFIVDSKAKRWLEYYAGLCDLKLPILDSLS